MAKRASFEESAQSKTGGDGSAKGNLPKVVVIVLAFVGAGAGLAWYFGLFDNAAPPPTAEEQMGTEQFQQTAEENRKTQERLEKIHKNPSGS